MQDKYQWIQLDKYPTSIAGLCLNLLEDIIKNSRVPELNFNAKTQYNMVNGQDCQLSEPPVTVKHSDEDISKFALDGSRVNNYKMQHSPCHTQAVERASKLAT